MIVEETLLHSPRQTVMTGAWRATIDRADVTEIRAVVCHFTRSLTEWARVPALPYAALWEASMVVSLMNQRASFDFDRSTADTSILSDAWVRG
jgi:hypothetical protein